jgi:hypothetical protein
VGTSDFHLFRPETAFGVNCRVLPFDSGARGRKPDFGGTKRSFATIATVFNPIRKRYGLDVKIEQPLRVFLGI